MTTKTQKYVSDEIVKAFYVNREVRPVQPTIHTSVMPGPIFVHKIRKDDAKFQKQSRNDESGLTYYYYHLLFLLGG